jgi:hypothetical protein
MKILILLTLACLLSNIVFSQDMSFSKQGKDMYVEMDNPVITDYEEWGKISDDVKVSFASDNIRYPKEKVPIVSLKRNWNVSAWRGEKVHTQILVWTKKNIPDLSFQTRDLINDKGHRVNRKNIRLGFVRYVMTDEFGCACEHRKTSDYDSLLVEDPIDIIDAMSVQTNTVQPIWLSVSVPGNTPAGKYTCTITINAIKKFDLKVSLNVLKHILPPPHQWKFDLDLWQSANSIAKVHDVELWSREHFNLMKPYFKMLANAGQKTITANIVDQPWGKNHIYYGDPSLIRWVKRRDGSWYFDYTVFDRYISFMMDCGIKKHINCYTMVTTDLSFIYFDEASGEKKALKADPGSKEYFDYWSTMLSDFTKHLRSKGWFNLTAIAMDERSIESMKAIIALLKQIDSGWKVALAGNYHQEIEKDIYDYSIYVTERFKDGELNQRKASGKPSTYYTACGIEHPNGHSYSPPAENTWISWYAASAGFTGYLRWAYNNWTKAPLLDTRFRTWPGGENYQIYPGPRSSIRFEKLIEGIQDFEKIRIIRQNCIEKGNEEELEALEGVLNSFKIEALDTIPAADMLIKAKEILNSY